ncbi:MAG: hypothetical protein IPN17_08630 [Deltaproteobacteria bacterium]|nr:hypothetical protein [Deltaproteobacteria bacterium]
MAFFVVVGALWSPHDRRGWIMLPIHVLARAGGKLLGVRAARVALAESSDGAQPGAMRLGPNASTWLALLPSSAVSIAVVVSARSSYPEMLKGSLETVVIGGALLSELVFRVSARALAGHGTKPGEDAVGASPSTTTTPTTIDRRSPRSLPARRRHHDDPLAHPAHPRRRADGLGLQLLGPGAVASSDAGTALAFGFLVLAAIQSGEIAAAARLPRLTGYLACGLACGPSAAGLSPRR